MMMTDPTDPTAGRTLRSGSKKRGGTNAPATRALTAGLSIAATSAIIAALALSAQPQGDAIVTVGLDASGSIASDQSLLDPTAGQPIVTVDGVPVDPSTVPATAGAAPVSAGSVGSIAPATTSAPASKSAPTQSSSAPVVTTPPVTAAPAPVTTVAPAPRPTTPPTTARTRAS